MKKAEAITYFGSQTKLANVLGIADPSVSQWGVIIPEKQAMKLERITGGKLIYEPELYRPNEISSTSVVPMSS